MSITQRWLRSLTVPISAPGGSSITNGRRHACLPVSWFRDLVGLADKIGLSSSFGGDSNRSDIGKRLLSSAFADFAGGSQEAHLRPCPFRRPSMAAGRPPHAGSLQPRKQGDTAGNRRVLANHLLSSTIGAARTSDAEPAWSSGSRRRLSEGRGTGTTVSRCAQIHPQLTRSPQIASLWVTSPRSCDDPAHRCGLATRATPSKSR
jgi:hypothetical protein